MKLTGMKNILLILFTLMSFQTFGYKLQLEGRILDKEEGFEIPGVNILEKGTKIGTVSDIDGILT